MQKSSEKKEKNKKKGAEKFFNKKILLIIICAIVVVGGLIIFLLFNSYANEETANVLAHSIDLDCEEYTSFDGELKCTLKGVIGPDDLSGMSVKLSESPINVVDKISSQYEAEVMSDNEYVDILFGDNVQSVTGERVFYAELTFKDITNPVRIESAEYYDFHYVPHQIDGSDIFNNAETPKTPSYGVTNILPGSPYSFIDSKYLLVASSSNNIKSTVENLINGDNFYFDGCTYDVSSNGKSIVLVDNYGNEKSIDVIHIASINSYSLGWFTSLNIYTRDAHTNEQVKRDCYDTNGYFVLDETNHKIKLYADSEHTNLLEERNWYYIYSTVYEFSNDGSMSLAGSISYQEFINTIRSFGVTFNMVGCADLECKGVNDITEGNLSARNRLNISGVPGYGNDFIDIVTNEEVTIDITNLKYKYMGGSANSINHVVYDINPGTPLISILYDFSISNNLTVKILDKKGDVLFNGTYSDVMEEARLINVTTDMSIVFTDGTLSYYYNISVLGDVMPDGEINLSDVIKLYRIMKNKEQNFTDAQRYAGDVIEDSDKTINTLDVAHLYRFFRGSDSTLKVYNN